MGTPEQGDIPDRRRLGRRIAQARHEAKLTASELAELVGCGRSTVYAWEAGRNAPRYAQIVRLSEVLNRPVGWFYGDEQHGTDGGPGRERLLLEVKRLLRELDGGSPQSGLLEQLPISGFVRLPVYSMASEERWDAGATEVRQLTLPVDLLPESCHAESCVVFVADVEGVVGGGIEKNAYLVVSQNVDHIEVGNMVLAQVGSEYRVGHYAESGGSGVLIPSSGRPVVPLHNGDLIGRVVLVVQEP